jgi:hypothetical protein
MFVNIKVYSGGNLIWQVDPYDATAATLKGLPANYSPYSPALGPGDVYDDALVYEMHPTSALTGEGSTFHFALATGRHKDNRIPPKGLRIAEAAARLADPVWQGQEAPDYYTAAEYAGGYDDVALTIPTAATGVEVTLYYQTTSREYVEFLRDEIEGHANTLTLDPSAGRNPAGGTETYLVRSDPFFAQLKAWGDTLWQLWLHNKDVPGAAPYQMARATFGNVGQACAPPIPALLTAVPGQGQVTLTWSDEHAVDSRVAGYNVYYDQSGKAQLVASLGLTTTCSDTGLTNGQEYCYKVTAYYDANCESGFSNIRCAIPNSQGQARAGVSSVVTGVYQGKGKNATFAVTSSFKQGDSVVVRAYVVDKSTGLPVTNATVQLAIVGPVSDSVTSGPSDAAGVAEASWRTQAPNKHGQGGTPTGPYAVTVTSVAASGHTWDGVETQTSFVLQH